MPSVLLHRDAEAELDAQAEWYEEQSRGLGNRFQQEFRNCVDAILDFPESGSPASANTRSRRIKHFPLHVIYQADEDTVLIVAVAHARRREDYWITRLDEPYP
jgi:toxin ParE1/3/4